MGTVRVCMWFVEDIIRITQSSGCLRVCVCPVWRPARDLCLHNLSVYTSICIHCSQRLHELEASPLWAVLPLGFEFAISSHYAGFKVAGLARLLLPLARVQSQCRKLLYITVVWAWQRGPHLRVQTSDYLEQNTLLKQIMSSLFSLLRNGSSWSSFCTEHWFTFSFILLVAVNAAFILVANPPSLAIIKMESQLPLFPAIIYSPTLQKRNCSL